MLKYSINLKWYEDDKCYIATVEEFPNLSAHGETYEEALDEIQIALKGAVDIMEEDNEKI